MYDTKIQWRVMRYRLYLRVLLKCWRFWGGGGSGEECWMISNGEGSKEHWKFTGGERCEEED